EPPPRNRKRLSPRSAAARRHPIVMELIPRLTEYPSESYMNIFQSVLRTSAVLALATTSALMAQGPMRFGGGPGFGFGGLGVPGLLNQTITGAPFSENLTVQRQQALAGGNQIQQQEQATVARDNQGRVRIDATVPRPASSGSQTRTEITIY